jgi:hypothetical protein
MPADIQDRLRELALHLERDVAHVSTNEVLARVGTERAAPMPPQVGRAGADGALRRRRWWPTAAAAGLIAVLVGGLIVTSGRDAGRTDPAPTTAPVDGELVIPDVVGELSHDAVDELQGLGLTVLITESVDPSGTFDTVVAIEPVPGSVVSTGSEVFITVAYPPGQGGPLDFATTDDPLEVWPHMSVSEPAATTIGYGLAWCSGVVTMRAAVESTTGPEHSYYGTMCSFITLDEPRPSTVVSCTTITEGTDYARCQRLTDRTESDGPGTHHTTTAKGDAAAILDPLPPATPVDVPFTFGATVSALANPTTAVDYEDSRVVVRVIDSGHSDTDLPIAVQIELPGAEVEATLGQQILQSGFAYAAYQDRSGTIDIIGVVPDDVTSIKIAAQTVPVSNNVWHYTADADEPLDFVVRSDDGTTASL